MTTRTLLRGACVVSGDLTIGDLPRGDVLIEDGRIAAVGEHLAVDDAAAEVVDAAGCIAMPGLVDAHRHTWSSALRLLAADWTLLEYFDGVMGRIAPWYRPEDVRTGNRLGAVEALDAGITTLLDWSHIMRSPAHADAAVDGLRSAGGRAVFAWGEPFAAPGDVVELRRLRDALPGGGLVTLELAAAGPDVAPLDAVERAWRGARELDLRISTHVGAGVLGDRGVARLAERGLLGPDTTYVHCNGLGADELALIAASGGAVTISPDVELHMGHGRPATGRLLAAGLRPALSVDACTNVGGDMFGAMRTLLAAHRGDEHQRLLDAGVQPERQPLGVRDVLSFATLDGARALGLEDRIGSLTPGKDADVVLLRADRPNLVPLNHPVAAIVLAAHPGNVESVLVRGRFVKRDGVLLDVDLGALAREAEASRDHLLAAAGVQHPQALAGVA